VLAGAIAGIAAIGAMAQATGEDRPPHLLGKRPTDLETVETTEIGTLRLIEFTTFDDG
jgi:hypothetical protein